MNLQAEPLRLKEATVTCIPRLRGGGVGRRSRSRGGGSAQVSVLDRVRDVVLRLAMLSAATSTNKQHQAGTTTLRRTATTTTRAEARVTPASYADTYRSEAVDDCIQFLKRSAAGGGAAPLPATAAVEEVASPLHAPPACATPCEP